MTTAVRSLVTGGNGFLGRAIVRLLLARGDRVRSLARRFDPGLDALGVNQITADIADAARVDEACQSMDVVYHTAAKAGVWGPAHAYYRANVIGTGNVIAACRKNGVRRLIHTSSPSVVFTGGDMAGGDESLPYPGAFLTAYPRTKALAEQMVRQAGQTELSTIALRPHLIWGPGDNHLVPRILKRAKRLRRIGRGCNRVDTIYIDNAAHAHVLADKALAKNPDLSGRVYFISQGEPVPVWEMIDAILDAGGRPPVKGRIPAPLAYGIGWAIESCYRLAGATGEPPLTRFVAKELATDHWFSMDAARQDLGYAPIVTISEGLERLRKWLMNDPYGMAKRSD